MSIQFSALTVLQLAPVSQVRGFKDSAVTWSQGFMAHPGDRLLLSSPPCQPKEDSTPKSEAALLTHFARRSKAHCVHSMASAGP